MTQIVANTVNIVSYETWLAAIASSACIGFTSLVPWLFNLTFFEKKPDMIYPKGGQSENGQMKFLLSFAVGAILGDIFFHLIPESYQSHMTEHNELKGGAHQTVGLSIIAGIFMFIIVDAILEKWSNTDPAHMNLSSNVRLKQEINHTGIAQTKTINSVCKNEYYKMNFKKKRSVQNGIIVKNRKCDISDNNNNANVPNLNNAQMNHNGMICDFNNNSNIIDKDSTNCKYRGHGLERLKDLVNVEQCKKQEVNEVRKRNELLSKTKPNISVDSAGYLNLIANGVDNFTHGLAIGASFLIGLKVGFLTTFVVIIHEIPHEICDYAILVNSGFTRWEAVKAQSSVSLLGIIGTATALYVKSVETLNAKTVWILPFTAGSFLYIALVNLLPEILDRKTDFRNSLGQLICVVLGIIFMALVAIF